MNRIGAGILAVLVLSAVPAYAQLAAPTALTITAENRNATAEAAAGHPRATDAVQGGDVVVYRLRFTNVTDQPVQGVLLRNPLPAGLRLRPGSIQVSGGEAQAEYSIDGGRSFSAEPMEEVVVDGRKVLRPAPPERFTDVRWRVQGSVAPRAVVTAEYEVTLAQPSRTAQVIVQNGSR